MRGTLPLLLLLLAPSALGAVSVGRSWIEELPASDLVIEGVMEDVNLQVRGGVVHARGTLSVRRVFAGQLRESTISLVWHNQVGMICPRRDPERSLGQPAIWLLRTTGGGLYTLAHDSYVVELGDPVKVESALIDLTESRSRWNGNRTALYQAVLERIRDARIALIGADGLNGAGIN